ASFQATATTELYTLSLHDALPILGRQGNQDQRLQEQAGRVETVAGELSKQQAATATLTQSLEGLSSEQSRLNAAVNGLKGSLDRSEEHTSELQSRENLVCRLLLEK